MLSFKKKFYKLSLLSHKFRKFILILIDSFCILISFHIALFFSKNLLISSNQFTYFITSLFVSIPIYYFTGQYKGLSRYLGSSELYKIVGRNFLITLILTILFNIFFDPKISLTLVYLFWVMLCVTIGASKFILRDILKIINNKNKNRDKVMIYGAGAAGIQLASAILLEDDLKIVGFLDDNPELWGRTLMNLNIYSPNILDKKNKQFDKILFAISAIKRDRKREILKKVQNSGAHILQIPTLKEITNCEVKIDELRPLAIEDLLGREVIFPNKKLLGPDIKDSVICVTGAGGSIGRELALQILKLNPKTLILFEISEVSLFEIQQEILSYPFFNNSIKLKSVLGSTLDKKLLLKVIEDNNVEQIFHAAAYKHVPLVEENPLAGLYNNIFSTQTICECAKLTNLKKVILISSDKAVRPTNIMGVSKRISELIIQSFADVELKNKNKEVFTKFSMVRFGNVLNSSGSVVPLFKKQISEGGPITLTDPKVIRYFMTIPEAAQLVIQAATLSEGGEVFLLDMGDPISIKDLAIQMIHLSGLTVKDSSNPEGDIGIEITGLRPGEKLYEELLIDGECKPTAHSLIFKANEKFIPYEELNNKLKYLLNLINNQETNLAVEIALSLANERKMEI
tara:strand:+ start:43222 stop:45105 length:1884 start_codon:yes stop_codon:yes gene_type:complete